MDTTVLLSQLSAKKLSGVKRVMESSGRAINGRLR